MARVVKQEVKHMDKTRESWSELEVKTKIAYITAIVAFALGWGLTIAGFVIGAGVISDSVLWVLGQALVYAASVFGVGMYITGSVRNMKRSIARFMIDERKHLENNEELEIEEDDSEIPVE